MRFLVIPFGLLNRASVYFSAQNRSAFPLLCALKVFANELCFVDGRAYD